MAIITGGTSGVQADVDSATKAMLVKFPEEDTFYGTYSATSGNLVVVATAHTASTGGFLWITNPAASSKIIRLERILVQTQFASALSVPTSPRISLSLMTFSGTPSGAAITPAKLDSQYPAPSLDIRTAITGLTCVYGATLATYLPVMAQGTAGWAAATPSTVEWVPREEEYEIVIRQGEGIVLWQQDNGTTSDTRKISFNLVWEEYA